METEATALVDVTTGEVTLVAVGGTLITAEKIGTAIHASVSESYTLTVVQPVMIVSLSITGTAKYSEVLTAVPNLTNAGTPTYQWKRDGNTIAGATAGTYTLVLADIGTVITVTATVDGVEGTGYITSGGTATVAKADGPVAPVEPIVGVFPVAATSIELTGLAANASGLEAVVAIDGSTYGSYADLSVDRDGKAAITDLVGVTTVTKVRIRMKETTTSLAGTAKEITVTESLVVGDSYGGGKVAYIFQIGDTGYVEGEVHGLIAATADNNSGTGIGWSNVSLDLIGITAQGTAIGTGQANTSAIISQPGHISSAAKVCSDYSIIIGNVTYDDWFLPSKDELNKLYANKAAIGGFSAVDYWSSSEYNVNYAWFHDFSIGLQIANHNKAGFKRVRAVRAF